MCPKLYSAYLVYLKAEKKQSFFYNDTDSGSWKCVV